MGKLYNGFRIDRRDRKMWDLAERYARFCEKYGEYGFTDIYDDSDDGIRKLTEFAYELLSDGSFDSLIEDIDDVYASGADDPEERKERDAIVSGIKELKRTASTRDHKTIFKIRRKD